MIVTRKKARIKQGVRKGSHRQFSQPITSRSQYQPQPETQEGMYQRPPRPPRTQNPDEKNHLTSRRPRAHYRGNCAHEVQCQIVRPAQRRKLRITTADPKRLLSTKPPFNMESNSIAKIRDSKRTSGCSKEHVQTLFTTQTAEPRITA